MRTALRVSAFSILSLAAGIPASAAPQSAAITKVNLPFPPAAHDGAITGRVFFMISPSDTGEPRLRAGGPGDTAPIFGADVSALAAGQVAVIDGSTPGYPTRTLRDVPAGDYYVQGLVNV